jgi:hypothetical protein
MCCFGGFCGLGGFGVGETHRSSRHALQCSVHGARVAHEVDAGPGIRGEKVGRKLIAFQPITRRARENDVPGMVHAAVGEWVDVIEGRRAEIERNAAIDAATAAVAHRGSFDGALITGSAELGDPRAPSATGKAWEAGEHDAVLLSTNGGGHFTSRKKTKPRGRRNSQRGVSDHFVAVLATNRPRHCRARLNFGLQSRCRSSVRASEGPGGSLRGINVMPSSAAQE